MLSMAQTGLHYYQRHERCRVREDYQVGNDNCGVVLFRHTNAPKPRSWRHLAARNRAMSTICR